MSPLMVQALDVIGLLMDTGLAVVEAEPNDNMVAAGMAPSGLGEDRVRTIFKAMLAANNKVAPGFNRAPAVVSGVFPILYQ
jgi:hypothetical protein